MEPLEYTPGELSPSHCLSLRVSWWKQISGHLCYTSLSNVLHSEQLYTHYDPFAWYIEILLLAKRSCRSDGTVIVWGLLLAYLSTADSNNNLNLLTPNVNYSGRTAPLTSKVAFYIFIQQI